MARARNIKPSFFMNEDLVELPFETRLLFIGLWTLADREGRLEDRPKRIRAQIFPYDNVDTNVALDQLASTGMIVRYRADDGDYIHITKFTRHQNPHYKEVPSEIPPPPGVENSEVAAPPTTKGQRGRILDRDGRKCQECGSTERLQIDHIVPKSRGGLSTDDNLQVLCIRCNASKGNRIASSDVIQHQSDVGSTSDQTRYENPADSLNLIPDSLGSAANADASTPKPKRATQVPDGFTVTDGLEAWGAKQEPPFSPESMRVEVPQFVDYYQAKGETRKDWDASFRTWMRNSRKWTKPSPPPKSGSRITSIDELFATGDDDDRDRSQEDSRNTATTLASDRPGQVGGASMDGRYEEARFRAIAGGRR